ncbi:hypothetical protein VTK56DRAFT_3407 [Thermocarpiscus australiensis]
MEPAKDDPIARRREQNRLAQRRSRWKQSQRKASARKQERQDKTGSASPQPNQLGMPSFSSVSETILSPNAFSMTFEIDEPGHSAEIPCPVVPGGLLGDHTYSDFSDLGGFLPQPSTCAAYMMGGLSLVGEDATGGTTPTHQSPDSSALRRGSRSASLSNSIPAREPPPPSRGPALERGWLGPLHLAAAKGNDRIVRILLKHRSPDCSVNEPDSDGLTALMHAVQGGFEDVVRSLLDAGAAVDDTDKRKRTALHWAVLTRREALLRQLLEHGVVAGANLDVYDTEGKTPLHSAIAVGFEAGVQVLLEFGVNTRCRAQKS